MIARSFGLIAIVAALMLGSIAHAVTFEDETPFEQAAFDAAQQDGKPILVHVTASWCSVCEVQKEILAELRKEDKFKPLLVFNVDFDTQKDLVRQFRVTKQSTMIVFKGKTAEGFFSGDTRPKGVELLLSRAFRGRVDLAPSPTMTRHGAATAP